jgi:hypothetical protein
MSLDDRIDILNGHATEDFPANEVFGAAVAILLFVRVRPFFQCAHSWALDLIDDPTKDEMIDDEYFVQLSEYCFDVCETLRNAISGKNAGNLVEFERMVVEYLERYIR